MTTPGAARLLGAQNSYVEQYRERGSDGAFHATHMMKESMSQQCARVTSKRRRFKRTSGFSMLEMLIVLIVIGILVKITVNKTSRIMRHERVNRAAQVLVQDLQNGFAMAGRQRAPVRLTFTSSTKTYVFTDRLTGTVFQTRSMSTGTEYQLTTLAPSVTTVDILPNGIGSTAFYVDLTLGDFSRRVTASSAGFVRSSQ